MCHLADGSDLISDDFLSEIRLFHRVVAFGHEFVVGADVQHVDEHLGDLLADERQRPSEHVHEIGQPIRMRGTVELANIHNVVFVFENGRFVVVHVQVVGCRENGDEAGETGRLTLAVHTVAGVLRLVRADDGQQVVFLQEVAARVITVEIGASSDRVVGEVFGVLLVAEVFERVGPEQVAHRPERGRLLEPVQLANVVQVVYFGGEAAVDAEELLVHERRQRQAVEGVHARVVHLLRILDLALLFEGEVFSEMPALVVTPAATYTHVNHDKFNNFK